MRLIFEDVDGETGVIRTDLRVRYDGKWRQEVEECVDSVEAEITEYGEYTVDEAFTLLIADLPDAAPIVEVERVNASAEEE